MKLIRSFSSQVGGGLSQFGGVHGTRTTPGNSKLWRSKPLLRREGDKVFKTGTEAANLLLNEAIRREDVSSAPFVSQWSLLSQSLAVVFDRMPKYAWIMKQLLEPERSYIVFI